MLSQAQFERYQLSRYLKEWRESEWDKTARFLLTARMGQEAIKNIGEYWFGIPPVPRFQVAWEFPEHIARIVGMLKYMLSRVPCDNALCLKSIPKMADEDIYPQSITDAWIQRHVHEQGEIPMSMVSHLNAEYMEAQCPCCGKTCTVWESDLYGTLMDGKDNTTKEYSVRCPRCDQSFYASTAY